MGPSGSGKTTLLDAVSGRTKKDKVSGTVSFNGRADIPFAQRNRLLSYVAQEDSLLGVFTVAESLRFAVRFYHGYGTADTEALEVEALSLVGLESARDTIVGDIFRKGLSGGQKRRLSLAVELVKQPAVRTAPSLFPPIFPALGPSPSQSPSPSSSPSPSRQPQPPAPSPSPQPQPSTPASPSPSPSPRLTSRCSSSTSPPRASTRPPPTA